MTELLIEQINETVKVGMESIRKETKQEVELMRAEITNKFDDTIRDLCKNCQMWKEWYGDPAHPDHKSLKQLLVEHLEFHKRLKKIVKAIIGLATTAAGAMSLEDIRKLFHR